MTLTSPLSGSIVELTLRGAGGGPENVNSTGWLAGPGPLAFSATARWGLEQLRPPAQ